MSSPSERRVRLSMVVSESRRAAVASPASTTVLALIAAGVTAFILSTTGQTVRAEQEVLDRIDQVGTRLVSVVDSDGTAMISSTAVERISQLSSVQWVIGLGYANDGRNSHLGSGGSPVAVREVWGELPSDVVVNGKMPRPGEGIVGVDTKGIAGLEHPIGSLDVGDRQVAVVGEFTTNDALGFLRNTALAAPDADSIGRLRSLHVMATSPSQVAPLTRAVLAVIGAEDPLKLAVETSQTLADLRIAVAGELGTFGRGMILAALGVSLLLVALVVYGSVTLRRQDFGRRRALGALRTTIVGMVATQILLIALVGVGFGVIVGVIVVWRLTGGFPEPGFALAVATLTVLVTLIASIPPALIAALRDPVRVLRVP